MCQGRIANQISLIVLPAQKWLSMSVAAMVAIRPHGFFA